MAEATLLAKDQKTKVSSIMCVSITFPCGDEWCAYVEIWYEE